MSRRKPALRIGGGVLNRSTLYQKNVPENEGLGLRGSHGDNDEKKIDSPSLVQNNLTQAIHNLDSKVADFLKEIDELEAGDTKEQDTQAVQSQQISYGSWQQCIDENTQHPYYWNTETNEVTWVLPEEISKQLEAVSQVPQAHVETDTTAVKDININEESEDHNKNDQETTDVKNQAKIESSIAVQNETQNEDSFDIDVDAELEQALESVSDPIVQPTELDIEIEILRRRLLPLSDQEEQDLMTRFESEILKLEEAEEEKRKKGIWKNYDKQVLERKNEINLDKTKWRTERLPVLQKMGLTPEKEEQSEIFSDEEEDFEQNHVDDDTITHIKDIDPSHNKLNESKLSKILDVEPQETTNTDSSTLNNAIPDDASKTKDDISTLSGTIFDKLNFLGISAKAFTNFHRLLIELETRITDWKEDVLPASYLLKKLQIATQQLKTYEETATPDGWSCQWDRSAKRYFYVNNKTKEAQWHYPESKKEDESIESSDIASKKEDSNKNKRSGTPVTSEINIQTKKSKTEKEDDISSKNTSDVPKRMPTSSTQSLYQGYTQNYSSYPSPFSMEGPQPPPPPGEESVPFEIPPPLPSAPAEKPPLPPPPPDEDVEGDVEDFENDDGIMMEMSDEEDNVKKAEADTTSAIMSQPVLYKPQVQSHFQAPSRTGYAMYMTQNSDLSYVQRSSSPLSQVEGSSSPQAVPQSSSLMKASVSNTKSKKVKKVKKSAVVKKPAKGISSLVAQWQKAKHQIEEEDRMLEKDDEDEIDHKELSKKQIEKWKQEQILSGKASSNANFEPVPEDWRNRILKKKGKG
ncbi:uncharacterized protein LOC120334230 [Styela clava]